jgi:hypothetical protein
MQQEVPGKGILGRGCVLLCHYRVKNSRGQRRRAEEITKLQDASSRLTYPPQDDRRQDQTQRPDPARYPALPLHLHIVMGRNSDSDLRVWIRLCNDLGLDLSFSFGSVGFGRQSGISRALLPLYTTPERLISISFRYPSPPKRGGNKDREIEPRLTLAQSSDNLFLPDLQSLFQDLAPNANLGT